MSRSYKRRKEVWDFKRQLNVEVQEGSDYWSRYRKSIWLHPGEEPYEKLRRRFFSEKANPKDDKSGSWIWDRKAHRRKENHQLFLWTKNPEKELLFHSFKKEGIFDSYY